MGLYALDGALPCVDVDAGRGVGLPGRLTHRHPRGQ